MKGKLDTRAIGLDAGLKFVHWLTGAENLHYGFWPGLEVTAANLGRAQAAYTDHLFAHLPGRPGLRILDIGGGAGETAKKLIALGHAVEIVVPSAYLAERCRANAPAAQVHQCRFEDFATDRRFDLCLFSESFQYVRLDTGLSRALSLLADDGEILIADCFRSEAWPGPAAGAVVGGGHPVARFRAELAALPLAILAEEDITEAVAPSVEIEQGLFNVIGHALTRLDSELAARRPRSRWLAHRLMRLFLSERRRNRLDRRLNRQDRSAAAFIANNRYLILRLGRA